MSVSVQHTLITPAEIEAVSLGTLKEYFQIPEDVGANDNFVVRVGQTAREAIETELRRQLITAEWSSAYDRFPIGERFIEVPKPPLQEVTKVEYRDPETHEFVEMDSDDYVVRTDTEPGRIELAYAKEWPSVLEQPASVRLTYMAGYGDDESDVPATIATAICALAKHLYDLPGPGISTGSQPVVLPLHLEYLLQTVRWHAMGAE